MIEKRVKTTADAVAGVRDGSTVLVAGFGVVGIADQPWRPSRRQSARRLRGLVTPQGLSAIEMIPGMTIEKLQALTEPKLQLASTWQALAPPEARAA